jgi:hypothetical protein
MNRQFRAYNLFRQVNDPALLCAIPADCVTPPFLVAPDWEHAGTTSLPNGATRARAPLARADGPATVPGAIAARSERTGRKPIRPA